MWAVILLVGVGTAACGGDADENAAGDSATTTTTAAGDGDGCLLTEEAVGDSVGGPVTAAGPVAGGSGGSGAGGADYGMTWEGCAYTGPRSGSVDDGDGDGAGAGGGDGLGEVQVAELVDDAGESDVSGFDQLAALAAEEAGPDLRGLGDEAFTDDTELVVRAGATTFLLGFGPGAEPTVDDLATLVEVGRGLIAEGRTEVAALCDAAVGLVPADWQPAGEPVTGTADGLAGGLDYTYDTCTVPLLDGGAELNVGVAAADVYDARVIAEQPADDDTQTIDGLGDEALLHEDALYVKVGARAARVEGETPDGEPLARATLEALGQALVDSLS